MYADASTAPVILIKRYEKPCPITMMMMTSIRTIAYTSNHAFLLSLKTILFIARIVYTKNHNYSLITCGKNKQKKKVS